MYREVLSYPGQKLQIDCVGPFTATEFQGKLCKYYLTITDAFTRYLVTAPLPSTSTIDVANALLEKYFYVF